MVLSFMEFMSQTNPRSFLRKTWYFIWKDNSLLSWLVNILLAFIGSIALVLYIWAGILWMSSAGNTERVSRARSIMLWTTLGVAVMLGSYVIVTFVFDIFK